MIKVYRIKMWHNSPDCLNCGARGTTRLSVLRHDGGGLVALDLCDKCAAKTSDALSARPRKRALKDLLGKPWKPGT